MEFLKIPAYNTTVDHSYHIYPLQIDLKESKNIKLEFFVKMRSHGINLQVHYIPVHFQPYYQRNYGFNNGDFPVAENFYNQEVSLPIYPDLLTDDVSFVINKIMDVILE